MPSLLTYFRTPPQFDVWHSHPGIQSRVLITAGIDGDEYDGIEAAKSLINTYNGDIPTTIIPIVNIAGYQAKISQNPLDGRHPKHIYPGNQYGSSSSKLIYQMSKHVSSVELWVDLHGGATDEHLNPFVWAQKTNNTIVDQRTTRLLSYLKTTTLYTNSTTLPPALPLAEHNTSYIMLESGELGQPTKRNTQRHIDWVSAILKNLDNEKSQRFTLTYGVVKYSNTGKQKLNDYLWQNSKITAIGA